MARLDVAPRQQERAFGPHELFFSTTDKKGVIEAGNEVFTRVAGFTLEELIGQPHLSLIHI